MNAFVVVTGTLLDVRGLVSLQTRLRLRKVMKDPGTGSSSITPLSSLRDFLFSTFTETANINIYTDIIIEREVVQEDPGPGSFMTM